MNDRKDCAGTPDAWPNRAEGFSIFAIFAVSRLAIWLAGYLGAHAFGAGAIEPLYLCRHDCRWYMDIVANGYQQLPEGTPPGSANWAFFPLYPLLVRALARCLSIDPVAAGVIVSNLAFLLASYVFSAYWRKTVSDDHRSMIHAVTLLCYSPGTIYFMSPYSESLFLLLSLSCLYCAAEDKWLGAGVAAACLTATRLVGILIIPAMLLMALQRSRRSDLLKSELHSPRILLAVALAPLGLAAFMLHLYRRAGDALAFAHVQTAWGREPGNPLLILWTGFQNDRQDDFWFATVVAAALGLSGLALARKRYAEGFLLVAGVMVPLSTSLFSMPRYVFSLFPCYTMLAIHSARHESVKGSALAISAAAAGVYAIAWALWAGFAC